MAPSSSESSTLQLTPFGAPMLKHFLFAEGYRNFNHGSYGTYPRSVQHSLRQFQDAAEAHPDMFLRRDRPILLDEARSAVGKLLNAPTHECVFVRNATTGVNTVLRNLVFSEGDAIVYFATIYGAIENAIVHLTETTPVRARKVEYQLPLSHEEIVQRFRDVVAKAKADGLTVRVAVFDTIVSQPAVRFPFERLIEVCREDRILSVVDGAHAIGQIPLDLGTLQPDFFVSNCHKWLFTPRGCAVLYVPLRNQHLLRTTLPTSWGFIPAAASLDAPSPVADDNKSAFELLFERTATTDDAAYFTVPDAIRFRQEVCGGEDRIYMYLETLAREAGDIIAAALGTEVLQEPGLKPGEVSQLRRCAMATVRLPLAYYEEDTAQANNIQPNNHNNSSSSSNGNGSPYPPLTTPESLTALTWLQSTLINEHSTMVPIIRYGGYFWVRVSAQVYLQRSDFEWLAGILREVCERVGRREFVEGRGGEGGDVKIQGKL
ncbi:hypothetical protein VTN77DRAFT_5608 [Rasamsonia byssochlamydoides]|uniref:uncharacterized protein n=1 Tax=Rasamsonia byssochlamydoides TaxID=89139 RepID=UPI003743FBF9